ncbi:MAG: hypothetical protein A2W61_06170, partial [Deltaproteobacteria bacterium RIFCSPLOWO2_01_44_7]
MDKRWRSTTPCKVSLIRPPSIVSRYAIVAPLAVPLGVAYLASSLREAGHRVQLIDGVGLNTKEPRPWSDTTIYRGLSFEEIATLVDPQTNVIGVSCMFSSDWPFVREMIETIHHKHPEIPIVLGGEHVTAIPEICLNSCPYVSACVVGEGEETFLEFLEHFSEKKPLNSVAGLVFRNAEQHIVHTTPRNRIRNIDDIPWPAWDLVPMENYLSQHLSAGTRHGRSIGMLASRGCPYQCTFCSNLNMWTPRWFARDPEKVIDEIEHYVRCYQVENVEFFDLTAIIKREWILSFCNGLKRRGIKIVWQFPVGTRSEAVDREVARAMISSGCLIMGYAPESGSPDTLKQIKKMVHLPRLKQSMRECHEAGLNMKANMMLGFPSETHRNVWETLKFLLAMSWIGVHDISFFPFAPYPGSPLFEELRKKDKLPDIFSDQWFFSLAFSKLVGFKCYSEHYGKGMLRLYQALGYMIF